jgi:hypothetical protein
MSSAKEYRLLVVRIGEASLSREQRKPPAPDFPDAFIFGSVAALAAVVLVVALFSGMVGRSLLGWNQASMTARISEPGLQVNLAHPR